MGRTGRNHGRDGSRKVVWTGFYGLREKNFWNFSLRTLAGFTKSSAAAHDGARDRHRKRFIVRRAARSAPRMGRAMPRSARRRRRGDGRHATAGWQRRATRRARFRFFRRLFFPRSTLTLADAQSARRRNQRTAPRARRVAKNTGNSSVGVVVRLRSDSSQAARAARRLADDCSPRGAPPTSRSRSRASSLWTSCLFGRLAPLRALAIRHSAPHSATERSIVRRHDDLTLLNRARERATIAICARRCAQTCVRRRASREKFFAQSKFLAKTCCINFNKFVQLRASDIGFHAFQSLTSR